MKNSLFFKGKNINMKQFIEIWKKLEYSLFCRMKILIYKQKILKRLKKIRRDSVFVGEEY